MSKRLMRINSKDAFLKLEEGTEINAVLQNGRTYFGRLESVTPTHLFLVDTRGHQHEIFISDLYEIVFDRETVKTFAGH